MRPVSDLSGQLIAEKYELLRQIGHGGMGVVYEARNVTTLKRCAVKVLLRPELAADEEMVKRFFREARASGLIESEHVVAAYDSGIDTASHAYYVMDCLQGEDLHHTLKRVGSLNPIAAAKIGLQAASGLASAHALGIVHRDVKPANLFLVFTPDDEVKVKILDFGIAKVKMEVLQESAHTLTRAGSMLGTPTYMSPEQVKRASAIDESADVWSLGIVLFECISGSVPWGHADSVGELLAAVLTLDLPLLQDRAPWVRPSLAHIVHRALSRDLTHRMRRASELRDALRQILGNDVRLFRHELIPASEQERNSAAERLSLADTMTMHPVRHSGSAVVTSVLPRTKNRRRQFAAIGGVTALLASISWTIAHRVPVHVSGAPPSSAPTIQRAVPLVTAVAATKSFTLQVSPTDVELSVDGVSTPVTDGNAVIRGPVGSVHRVALQRGNQRIEVPVAITDIGLVPPKVDVPSRLTTSRPASKTGTRSGLPDGGSPPPTTAPDSAGANSQKSTDGGLSVIFE